MTTHPALRGVRRANRATDLDSHAPSGDGEAILRHLVDFLDAFMWQADPRTLEITFVTEGVHEILGYPRGAWLGGPDHWGQRILVEDRQRVIDALRATASDGADRDIEFHAYAEDGGVRTLRHAVRVIVPPSGETELWGVTTDVTGEVQTAKALEDARDRYRALSVEAAEFKRRSFEDPLTRLPNRALFHDRLGSALRTAARSGESVAVLLLDLDRFKQLNDTYGHLAGDAALKEFALRFRICLRSQDTPARLGGDEFAAVLPNTDESGAICVADRIVSALRDPLQSIDDNHVLGTSIGIAIHPTHGSEGDDLLAKADAAMYRAKASGGGYALATESGVDAEKPVTRRPKRRAARRIVIALAATLAIAAGAMTPAGQKREDTFDAARRLQAAAVILEGAKNVEVAEVVAGVENTMSLIPLGDVVKDDVATALHDLERKLHGIRSDLDEVLGNRVEKLIASIQQAEAIAREVKKPAPPKVPESGGDLRSPDTTPAPKPSPAPAPSLP